jgi:hypothetical protein
MVGVMVRADDGAKLQSMSAQVFQDGGRVSRIDDRRVLSVVQTPDVVVAKCPEGNDGNGRFFRGRIIHGCKGDW